MGRPRTAGGVPDPQHGLWDLLAYYLRECRTARGLSQEAVGHIVNAGKSTVSRIELGDERLDEVQAALLDEAWNVGGIFGYLIWYASIGHDPEWLSQYISVEQRAAMFRTWDALVIHGILQTEDYARTLLSVGMSHDPDQELRDRMARHAVFERKRPPFLEFIMSQTCLEWPIGSPRIMRDQLAHILACAELPHVIVRVVPRTWQTGAYPGLDGSFRLLSGEGFGEAAYSESVGGGRLVRSPSEVRTYSERFSRISAKALQVEQSTALIRSILEAYENECLAEEQA